MVQECKKETFLNSFLNKRGERPMSRLRTWLSPQDTVELRHTDERGQVCAGGRYRVEGGGRGGGAGWYPVGPLRSLFISFLLSCQGWGCHHAMHEHKTA